ncbi:trifolitoxin immunity protein [Bacillus sp. SA1-12]|uniref:aminoglycoside phosphotransferase family protein n=1 Tax=Bacillus sp. SA1-12 TaxID=1455638 RepID=UPI0006263833|nr:aminoglycoside phosphotransferase family protein [Bacillus sp. SA1-12]KKI91917.1 trifolitoxin immunity protein [Bacillus sp. SA1-12]
MISNSQCNESTEKILSEQKEVSKKADVVLRPAGKWTKNVHHVLNHLHRHGFTQAPQLVGSGFSSDGREALTYMNGDMIHPSPWSDEGLFELGKMIRSLHDIMKAFPPLENSCWQDWFIHDIGKPVIISHCDISPWNVLTKNGKPCAFIDWEYTGPVDPLIELSRSCWLFPYLVDDDLAISQGLPSPQKRAEQVRLIVDGYGLAKKERSGLFEKIIEVVVHETANEAIEGNVTSESVGPLWGFAWRSRSASWILKNRAVLENAIT